jgi:hypothetical protein
MGPNEPVRSVERCGNSVPGHRGFAHTMPGPGVGAGAARFTGLAAASTAPMIATCTIMLSATPPPRRTGLALDSSNTPSICPSAL